MIVDDSELTLAKLSSSLKQIGYDVVAIARDGNEVLTLYKEYMPDVVTMDITMKDKNGIEATKELVSYFPDALIIMLTSHGQEKMVVEAIDAGAKGYVLKPWTVQSLDEKIQKLLAKFKK